MIQVAKVTEAIPHHIHCIRGWSPPSNHPTLGDLYETSCFGVRTHQGNVLLHGHELWLVEALDDRRSHWKRWKGRNLSREEVLRGVDLHILFEVLSA